MYTEEWLSKIPFFHELLKTEKIEDITDSLTGLLTRGKILAYAKELIEEGIPFTYAVLDLDNFKMINDTYGHQAGDEVLAATAADLMRFLGEDGVAGRFGGDEFLIINGKIRSYDEKKVFCDKLFRSKAVLQKVFTLGGEEHRITGTMGCASFPDDASDYETLFSLADKTLYRGKTKGRNCYVIYVKEKHQNIEIQKFSHHNLYSTFRSMAVQFDSTPDLYEKMRRIYTVLREVLWISDFYYINEQRQIKSAVSSKVMGSASDVGSLVTDELYATNDLEKIRDICPVMYQSLKQSEIESFVVVRVGMGPFTFGYIMCAEPRSLRIWQDEEFAILFSLSRMLAGQIRGAGLKLE